MNVGVAVVAGKLMNQRPGAAVCVNEASWIPVDDGGRPGFPDGLVFVLI